MDVSIIIVNYNTRELTIQCLSSIYEQTKEIDFEIIVVDNASVDNSCISIKENFPNVLLIESKENLGFGRANNLGVKIAKGKYLFLLNSDTILLNNAIWYFHQFFETLPDTKIGAAGSILLDSELMPTHSSGRFPNIVNALKVPLFGYFDRNYFINSFRKEKKEFNNEAYFEIDYVTGADLFMPHQLYDNIGGFDPCFFLYYEETDLQKRLNYAGFKSVIIDDPKIIHLEGKSNKKPIFSNKTRIIFTKSEFLYFKKHSNLISYLVYRFCILIIRLPLLFDSRIPFADRIKYLSFLIIG